MHQPRAHGEQLFLAVPAALHQFPLGAAQLEDIPGENPKDDESQPQMRGQPVGRHIQHRPRQPRRHHPPAHSALNAAQDAGDQQLAGPARRDFLQGKETKEANCPDQPHETPQLTVAPFPPIDDLELVQRHALVLQLVLGNLAILVEFRLPLLGRHRRQRARHRPPFGDRQPAIGQPGQPAHRNHRHHQRKQHHEPDADRPARALAALIDHTGLTPGLVPALGAHLFEKLTFLGHPALRFGGTVVPRLRGFKRPATVWPAPNAVWRRVRNTSVRFSRLRGSARKG